MPAFRYEAVDAGGASKKGVLNADSARSARAELRAQGLVPLKVDQIAAQVDAAGARSSRRPRRAPVGHRAGAVHAPAGQPAGSRLPLEQAFTALEQAERRTCAT
jgi:general secretion pathway protein F